MACDSSTTCFDDLKVDKLVAREIVLKHPDSKITISMVATDKGAGIWVGDSKQSVAIHHIHDQVCLALMDPQSSSAHPLALSIDKDGKVFLQVADGHGGVKQVTQEQLAALASA